MTRAIAMPGRVAAGQLPWIGGRASQATRFVAVQHADPNQYALPKGDGMNSNKFRAIALATALTALVALAPGPSAASETLFKVTLLGTGSPVPEPTRNGPSTLVEVGGERLVFDMGRGNTVSLFRAHIPLGSIDAHFITHLHSDHINGLPDLYLTGWIGVPFGNRTKPFLVYGPQGTEAMMEHLYAAFSEDRRIRFEDEHYPLSGVEVVAHDINEGVVYESKGIKVSAFPVFHGEHVKPAFGFRIDYKGHSVVLSGDTKYSKRVETEATSVDLLIHEVATISGDPERAIADHPVFRIVLDHHTEPRQAGALFAKARPKLAVYSHLVLMSDGVSRATPANLLAQTRTVYDGPLAVGEDMMQFVVTDTLVEMVTPKR